jgi:hypothetical protein
MTEPHYIYAEDPHIGKRCVHVVKGGYAVSMLSGHKFRFDYTAFMKDNNKLKCFRCKGTGVSQ